MKKIRLSDCPVTVYQDEQVSAIVYDTHEFAVEHALHELARDDLSEVEYADWVRQAVLPEGYRITFRSDPSLSQKEAAGLIDDFLVHLVLNEGVEAMPVIVFDDEKRAWIESGFDPNSDNDFGPETRAYRPDVI